MANKKCPKCGEDNPAEAVMCWACYTPLSGAAPLTVGAAALPATAGAANRPGGPGGPGAIDVSADEKKGLDPKIIGVVAVLLLLVVGGGVVMFGMGGTSTTTDTAMVGGGDTPASAEGAPALPPPAPPPAIAIAPSGAGPVVAAVPLPFQTVVQPNPNVSTGTVGILANQATISPQQAVGLAKAARNQFMTNGRWKNMQIAVFTDSASANGFKTYQAGRRGAKLEGADFQALATQGVWTGAAAFYETVGNREYPSYPKSNPTGWWSRSR